MALSCDLRICGSCRFSLSHICHTEQYFLIYNYILIINMWFLHLYALYQWFRRRCSIGLARNRTCHNSWVFTKFCLLFIVSYLELHVLCIFYLIASLLAPQKRKGHPTIFINICNHGCTVTPQLIAAAILFHNLIFPAYHWWRTVPGTDF